MNKEELVVAVAEKVGVSKKRAGEIIDGVQEFVTAQLAAGRSIDLLGFGKLSVEQRAARSGTNPATGEKIQIKARKAVKFKPGKQLKAAVAG